MHQQAYRLGPTLLEVTAATGQQRIYLARLWGELFQVQPVAEAVAAPLRLNLTALPPMPPQPASTEIFRHGALQLYQKAVAADGSFVLTCGASWLQVAVAQGAAVGHLAADFTTYGLVAQREFFQVLFFLLLRRQGYYMVHANAVLPPPQASTPQAGVLLIGGCGVGKTTLTLSLLQAGWRCVGDDMLILAKTDADTVIAYGLRRGFACTPQTTQAFPALQPLLADGPALAHNKKFIQAEACYAAQFTPHCTPYLLLFPTIAPQPASALVDLPAATGMSHLLGQPRAGVLFDPPTIDGHFQLYGQLVRQATSAQFLGGQDVLHAPAAVGQLLEQYLVGHVGKRAASALRGSA